MAFLVVSTVGSGIIWSEHPRLWENEQKECQILQSRLLSWSIFALSVCVGILILGFGLDFLREIWFFLVLNFYICDG